jgi:hypothetical protein
MAVFIPSVSGKRGRKAKNEENQTNAGWGTLLGILLGGELTTVVLPRRASLSTFP